MTKTDAVIFVEEAENKCKELFYNSSLSDSISVTMTEDTCRYDAYTNSTISAALEFKNRTTYNSDYLPKEWDSTHTYKEDGTVWCRKDKVDALASLPMISAFVSFFSNNILYINTRYIQSLAAVGIAKVKTDLVYNPVKKRRQYEDNYHVPIIYFKKANYKQ